MLCAKSLSGVYLPDSVVAQTADTGEATDGQYVRWRHEISDEMHERITQRWQLYIHKYGYGSTRENG